MFPTIGDLVSYLFGITVRINLQTFGTFMALAFAGAYVVFVAEFKRKENDGTIGTIPVKAVDARKSTPVEIGLNALLGFILGYKLLDVVLALFHGQDPAVGLLSLHGNWIAGIVMALIWAGWIYFDHQQNVAAYQMHPYQLMPYITFMVAVWGFLGAKLFDTAEHLQELSYVPLKVLLSRNGFTYYGGLVFGALTYLWIGYRHKIKLIHMADIGSPGMMLAYGLGRIGCQLSGDGDWGVANRHIKPDWIPQWAWASTYPRNAINAGVYTPGCNCYQLTVGVWPTPLYESVLCIGLFLLMWVFRRRIKTPGFMFFLFLMLNGAERFLIEKLRVTPKYHFLFLQLSQAQMIALLFMAGGLVGFTWLAYRRKIALS
jgi:phosphatidylglycerol---prolipoprotein diacylglyceryl transferase